MDKERRELVPVFIEGTEVALSRDQNQPGFSEQLSLLDGEPRPRKKLYTALIVVFSVFIAGMVAGAVAGIFI